MVYSIKKAQALLFVLDSFSCGRASAAADNNTSSHSRGGSHRTSNNSSGYATGNGTHGGLYSALNLSKTSMIGAGSETSDTITRTFPTWITSP